MEYAEPAAAHLWEALDSLALTAGLLDVAMPAPATGNHGPGEALTTLQTAARDCAERVCAPGEPVAGPADVARAIANTLAALGPVFGRVQEWVNWYVPGRGRELPETARRHLHEATGRWAPIAGLITHVPADPEPEIPAEEKDTEIPEEVAESVTAEPAPTVAAPSSSTPPVTKAQGRSRRATK